MPHRGHVPDGRNPALVAGFDGGEMLNREGLTVNAFVTSENAGCDESSFSFASS